MLSVCLTSPNTGPCHFQTQQGLRPLGRNLEIVQATGYQAKGKSERPRGAVQTQIAGLCSQSC